MYNTACTQSKTGMVAYLGDVHTRRGDTVSILFYITNFTSNTPQQRKLDHLKMESKGATVTNETPTCALPAHAPQTNAV